LVLPRAAQPPAASCEAAIAAAQQAVRLPSGLPQALAIVESERSDPRTRTVRPWPWTINVGGEGYFFACASAAITPVRQLQAVGIRSIDVGCLQVNLMYHPLAFAGLAQAFDPMTNARYAASFLTSLYEQTRDWNLAAADYHSRTPSLGTRDERTMLAHWQPPAGTVSVRRYTDFQPRSSVHRDFQPGVAYADFAGAFDQPRNR
jgi:Transglycosylase SLT domain